MFGLINTIFEYVVMSIQFLSKTGSLASYDNEDDFKLAGHDILRTTAKQKRGKDEPNKITSQSAELEQVADGDAKKESASSQTETTSEKHASEEATNKKADEEIVDFKYVDVEAKRARYAELLKEKEKRNLTKQEVQDLDDAKLYRSGYAKFNDKIDEIVDKKFKNAPRLKKFIKGAADFLSSRGISLVFAGISLSFVLGSLILAATAPVIVPVVIGLTATGLGLGLIFLGKAFVSMVTGDRALQQAKQDYSLSEEIKREKGDLDATLNEKPELKLLLGNSMLMAFGKNGRGSYSTGGIIAKDLLYEAPSFGLAIASSAISLNVPAILVTIFSTIVFRASSIKQSLAAAKSYTEFGNYMAQLEESLGIRNATPEQKAEILGRIRQLRSALDEFLKNPKNEKKLEELNKRVEEQKGEISELDSKIKKIDERILKLEALNKVKNNDDFIELEKALIEAIQKEPFIKPEVKKPSLWESFKRVYNPRNLFSYERNCEMQTPFGADSKFYKACSREEYESDRRQAKDIHMKSLEAEKGKEESQRLPNYVREENVLEELRSQKAQQRVEAERQKALEKQKSLRAQSKSSSTKTSTIHTLKRL